MPKYLNVDVVLILDSKRKNECIDFTISFSVCACAGFIVEKFFDFQLKFFFVSFWQHYRHKIIQLIRTTNSKIINYLIEIINKT